MKPTPARISKFCVYYDGEAHDKHEMDIGALGASLTALGNALHAANAVLNGYGEDSRIDVKVNADFIDGSFGFEVELFQYLDVAKDVVAILGLTAISGGGALAVIDWLKGKKIDVVTEQTGNQSLLKVGDKELLCDNDIADLVEDSRVRKSLQDFIYQPLQNEGTRVFAIKRTREDEQPAITIDREKAKAYKAPPTPVKEEKSETETEARVQFIKAAVAKKAGWSMIFQGEEHAVRMNDEAFLARLKNMEEAYVFGKTFNVKLKKKTKKSIEGDKVSYSITTVHHESKS